MSEPIPPNARGLAPVRPEDGPQDVPQEPGSVVPDEGEGE
ncbi:hypothetical protein GCM10023196_035450 [Actinoallomurus vinaceus]|uniref:Uncharacterized protein n=1 Tax=Actinoallomurus vinaceus TaxID=1080074 RepID=A0ABP8UBJ9_9ACTN